MAKLLATIKYYCWRKWIVTLFYDPFGLTEFLSGGLTQTTQTKEYERYKNFINGKTDKY